MKNLLFLAWLFPLYLILSCQNCSGEDAIANAYGLIFIAFPVAITATIIRFCIRGK